MNRVVHFEIQADNIERAIKFYKNVFGWEFNKWENPGMEYWFVLTAPEGSKEPGINGGLLKRDSKLIPQQNFNSYVCTISVANYEESSKKITNNGGKTIMPKSAIPGTAWVGYFLDTEGNTFGLYQEDKNAK